MRNDIELLRILRRETRVHSKKRLLYGLCGVIKDSRDIGVISFSEAYRLKDIYLEYSRKRTRFYTAFSVYTDDSSAFAWKLGALEPRLKWIDSEIKKRIKKTKS